MPARLVLIGLPGVGKSTVGARLARRWHLEFADSDELIVARDGRSVSEIFAADGEPTFRALEAAVVIEALDSFDGVLALGGGAVTTATVREALIASPAPVVLLTAGRDVLLGRIGRTRHRPLLAGDRRATLEKLEAERAELYRAVATVQLDTAGMTLVEVTEALATRMAP